MPVTATKPKARRASVSEIALPSPPARPIATPGEEDAPRLFDVAEEEGEVVYLDAEVLEVWEKNPRLYRDPAHVADIAQSIKDTRRQDDELKVREKPGFSGHFEIIEGGTRFEGRHLNGRQVWRCRLYRNLSDKAALDMAGRSQFKRRDWGPLDLANFYKLQRQEIAHAKGRAKPEEVSLRELESELGVNYEQLRQYLALLEMPGDVRAQFAKAKLTEGHGREILRLQGHEAQQLAAIEWAAQNGKQAEDGTRENATIAATAKEVKRHLQELGIEPKPSTKAKKAAKDAQSPPLDFGGDVSTRVDSKGNPDDSELPKEDDWKATGAAQKGGVNGVSSSAPASSGTGFATSPEDGQTVHQAPGQTGTRQVKSNKDRVKEDPGQWVKEKAALLSQLKSELGEFAEIFKGSSYLNRAQVFTLLDGLIDVKFATLAALDELEVLKGKTPK